MSQNTLADRHNETQLPIKSLAKNGSHPPATVSNTDDFAAWERLLLDEEWLMDAPPIPLEAMRREALYNTGS